MPTTPQEEHTRLGFDAIFDAVCKELVNIDPNMESKIWDTTFQRQVSDKAWAILSDRNEYTRAELIAAEKNKLEKLTISDLDIGALA